MNATISMTNKLRGTVSMANSKINGGASPYPKGASGNIITITDGAENTPLKSAVVNIEPVQSGSGDPSPTNIRPISGWTQANVWVKPTYDTTLAPTATISLGQTVYGGTLDVLAGKLVVDRAMVAFNGSEAYWGIPSVGTDYHQFTAWISGAKTGASVTALCDTFRKIALSERGTKTGLVSYATDAAFRFALKSDFGVTTRDEWTAYLAEHNVQLVYELAIPLEYDVTPQTIKTLLGVNNIWADAGEMSIEYYPAAASIVAVQNRSTKMYVSIPLGMIRYETYQITPQQTIDLDSYRSENGNLLRNPVATKCKLEFNTPLMTDSEWGEIWNIIKAGFNNNTERKLKLKYYDTLSATYKTGYFYVPDVQTTIRNIEEGPGVINYQEIRLAFIEY